MMDQNVAVSDPRYTKALAWIAGVGGSLTVAMLIWILATLMDLKVGFVEMRAQNEPINQTLRDMSGKLSRTEDRVGNIEGRLGLIEDRQRRLTQ